MLLKHLRGEHIDWNAIEEEFMPRAMCYGCGFVHCKPQYAPGQWARKTKQRYCRECVEAKKREGVPFQCNTCFLWKAETAFSERHRVPQALNSRHCIDCIEMRKCNECNQWKDESEFTESAWTHARKENAGSKKNAICRTCQYKAKGRWKCIACKERYDPSSFSTWLARWMSKERTGSKYCNTCSVKREHKQQGKWKCVECKGLYNRSDFSLWLAPRKTKANVMAQCAATSVKADKRKCKLAWLRKR